MGLFKRNSKKNTKGRSNSTASRKQGTYFNFPANSSNAAQQPAVGSGAPTGYYNKPGGMPGSNFAPMRNASGWGGQFQEAGSGGDYNAPMMQSRMQPQAQRRNNDALMSQGSFYAQMGMNPNMNMNPMSHMTLPNTRGYVNDARSMNAAYLAQRQPANYDYYQNCGNTQGNVSGMRGMRPQPQPQPQPQSYPMPMSNMGLQRVNSMQSMNSMMYSQPYNYNSYNNGNNGNVRNNMSGMGSQGNSYMSAGDNNGDYDDYDDNDMGGGGGGGMQSNMGGGGGSALQRAYSVSGGFHQFLNSQYHNNGPQRRGGGGGNYGSSSNGGMLMRSNSNGNMYNNNNNNDSGYGYVEENNDDSLAEDGDEGRGADGLDPYGNNSSAWAGGGGGRPMPASSIIIAQPGQPTNETLGILSQSGGMDNGGGAGDGSMPAPGELTRKESQKRIGMYFKNKNATDVEGVQYKDAKEATGARGGAHMRDMTLTNRMKPILIRKRTGEAHFAETDGSTIYLTPSGHDTVQEYKLTSIIHADPDDDANITGDALDDICYNFVSGCNVGMIMADAGFDSAKPDSWYTWQALREVMKGLFGRTSSSAELSVSVCLAQDDMVMDLLSDEPRKFVPLVVAENPLFGNVVNGVEFVYVNDASEFNVTLDTCLERATAENKTDEDEHGIVVVICVLKQIRTSQSTGKEDVIVSSLFASGVGNGVIHYTRILDKNPAEPRALFYSVMHRSVHSCAIFYCPDNDESVFQEYITVLRRIGEVEVRNPKPGSTRMFTSFGQASIAKLTEDIEKIIDPRQRMMMDRYLAKMKLMVEDAEEMLKNPKDAAPKTYV